jgi:hypothetical protein
MGLKEEEANWLGRRFHFSFVLCSYLGRSTSGVDVCRGEKEGEEEMTRRRKERMKENKK